MRPENLKFPKVFHKFGVKDKNNNEVVEYRIQDLPENLYEAALDLYAKDFFPDEIMCASRNILNNKAAFDEFMDFWREALKSRLTLACFKNDVEICEELVAVNILVVASKDDDKDLSKFKDKDIREILEALVYTFDESKIFEKYGVDKYLSAYGLVVNRKFRGQGIATEMLKARKPLLEAIGLKVTSTAFTVIGSQKAAKHAGYVEDYAISVFRELIKMRPQNLEFPMIFYKFQAKDSESDELIEYRVQDLPEELYEDVLHLYYENYLPDEDMNLSRGTHLKEFETNEMINYWREVLKHRLTIACFRNDGKFQNEIVAANFLFVCSKDDPKEDLSKFKDQDVRNIFETMSYAIDKANIFEKYGVDKYLSECGLVVNRKYRKRGIATEMLKARIPIMKTLELTVTSSTFSMAGSQKAAKKAGFVEDFAISYDELAKISPNLLFERGLSKIYNIMSLKI